MKFVFSLFVATILIGTRQANAQDTGKYPDYLITNKGDTITCLVKRPLLSNQQVYVTASSKKSNDILPEDVKEYSSSKDKAVYLSAYEEGKRKPKFFKVIEKGKINLLEELKTNVYVSNNFNGMSTVDRSTTKLFYVSKGTDTVKKIKSSSLWFFKSKKERKDELGDLFSDNQAVHDKYIADDKFSFKQIRILVHLYNTGELVKSFKDSDDD